jgi:hypothetical protein
LLLSVVIQVDHVAVNAALNPRQVSSSPVEVANMMKVVFHAYPRNPIKKLPADGGSSFA